MPQQKPQPPSPVEPATPPPIPADLKELWDYIQNSKEALPVDAEDMKAFILRLATADQRATQAEAALREEKSAHRHTNSRLVEAQAVISTTCKKWLEIIEEDRKKK